MIVDILNIIFISIYLHAHKKIWIFNEKKINTITLFNFRSFHVFFYNITYTKSIENNQFSYSPVGLIFFLKGRFKTYFQYEIHLSCLRTYISISKTYIFKHIYLNLYSQSFYTTIFFNQYAKYLTIIKHLYSPAGRNIPKDSKFISDIKCIHLSFILILVMMNLYLGFYWKIIYFLCKVKISPKKIYQQLIFIFIRILKLFFKIRNLL